MIIESNGGEINERNCRNSGARNRRATRDPCRKHNRMHICSVRRPLDLAISDGHNREFLRYGTLALRTISAAEMQTAD